MCILLIAMMLMMAMPIIRNSDTINENKEENKPMKTFRNIDRGTRSPGLYDSWLYEKQINITENNGTNLYNYSLRIDFQGGDETQNSFINWTKLNNNGTDIRFANYDKSETLNYWVEYWNDTSKNASVWVNIANMTASINTTVYMYYGNSNVQTESNITATFPFGDDFESYYPQVVSGNASYCSDVVELPDNSLLFTYFRYGTGVHKLFYKTSTDQGVSWSSETYISDGTHSQMDNVGNIIFLAYKNNHTDWHQKFRKSMDGGVTWGDEIAVTEDSGRDQAILAFNSTHLLIATPTWQLTAMDIWESTDGGDNWNKIKDNAVSGKTNCEDMLLFELTNDNIILVYEDEIVEHGKSYIYCLNSTDKGLNWGTETTVWNEEDNDADYEIGGMFYDDSGNLISGCLANEDEILPNCSYGNYKFKYKSSPDHGATWGSTSILINGSRGLGHEGKAIKTVDTKILIANTGRWNTEYLREVFLTRIDEDLTTPEIGIASSKWNLGGKGKMFIKNEGSLQSAQIEGYVSGDTTYNGFIYSDYNGSDYVLETRIKTLATLVNKNLRFAFRYSDAENHYIVAIKENDYILNKIVGGSSTSVDNAVGTYDIGNYHTYKVVCNGTSIKCYYDDVLKIDTTDDAFSSGNVTLSAGDTSNKDSPVYYDWVFVRESIYVEPTYSFFTEHFQVQLHNITLYVDYWNFKGYPNSTAINASVLYTQIPNCISICGKNTTSNYWYTYWPSIFIEDWVVSFGDGLFILVSQNTTWQVYNHTTDTNISKDIWVPVVYSSTANSNLNSVHSSIPNIKALIAKNATSGYYYTYAPVWGILENHNIIFGDGLFILATANTTWDHT